MRVWARNAAAEARAARQAAAKNFSSSAVNSAKRGRPILSIVQFQDLQIELSPKRITGKG
jgi:hypothetical protein